MLEYVAKFIELARFRDDYVAIYMAKMRKFEDGLKLSIRGKIADSSYRTWILWLGRPWPQRDR